MFHAAETFPFDWFDLGGFVSANSIAQKLRLYSWGEHPMDDRARKVEVGDAGDQGQRHFVDSLQKKADRYENRHSRISRHC